MTDDNTAMFYITEVVPALQNTWIACGRLYQTIVLGDSLVASSDKASVYVVKDMVTYGTKFSRLDAGLTAELTVEGENGDVLLSSKYFLRMPSPK